MAGAGTYYPTGAGHADPTLGEPVQPAVPQSTDQGTDAVRGAGAAATGRSPRAPAADGSEALDRVARFTQQQIEAAGRATSGGAEDSVVEVAVVARPQDCSACGACERVCPYGAVWLDRERGDVLDVPVVVDTAECTGCGACVRACPQEALELRPAASGPSGLREP